MGRRARESLANSKEAIIISACLIPQRWRSSLRNTVDASLFGLGAVLQVSINEVWKPVTYISQRLDPAEENYHASELEALGLVWSMEKLRPYIYGRKFTAQTDSNVLRWLTQKKKLMASLQDGSWHSWPCRSTHSISGASAENRM